MDEVNKNLARLETKMGKKLGDPNDPLLVSVRSGAAISMPGMVYFLFIYFVLLIKLIIKNKMDTVLNLGLNLQTLEGLIKKTNNPRFGWDAYRRFIQMYS